MTNASVENIYRLSSMQQGLLFHSLIDPDSRFYVDQVVYTLHGQLDEPAFEQVWRDAMRRHEMLRTSFHWEGLEELVQVVHDDAPIVVERRDWRDEPVWQHPALVDRYLSDDRARGFDFERPPLFRLSLLRQADDAWTFVFRYHHLLLDAWSALMVLEEVFARYGRAVGAAAAAEEPAAPRPYHDYVSWLRRQDLEGAEAYWRAALEGFDEPTPLPLGAAGTNPAAAEAAHHRESSERRLTIDAATTERLREVGRENRITLSTLMQGAWALLLSRYSDREDVLFGTTVSSRPPDLEGIQGTVGLFINTVPVRVRVDEDESVLACCERLQREQGAARRWDFSPLELVQQWSDAPRGAPLFHSIMTFLNVPGIATLSGHDGALTVRDGQYRYKTNYPLSIMIVPGDELSVRVGYDADRIADGSVERVLGHMSQVLEAVAYDATITVADVALLTPDEVAQLDRWAGAPGPSAAADTFHELVARQAVQDPGATAVVTPGQRIAYGELERRANQIAHHLREHDVRRGDVVGLCVERSADLALGALGILKAGAAFLPLDPQYPSDRLAFMLEDAGVHTMLSQSPLADRLPETGIRVLYLDREACMLDAQRQEAPSVVTGPDDLAYVIYTSGSTGQPKGAMLTHRGITNVAAAQRELLGTTGEDRVLQWASPSFDAAVFDLAMALTVGAELHVGAREDVAPGAALCSLLVDRRITCLTITPSALSALPGDGLDDLRLLVVAGEPLCAELADRWQAPARRVFNAYGPTEATIWATVAECLPGAGTPSIGRPIGNVLATVHDRHGRLVPVGVTGELRLAGDGVGRGYIGRPELTAARFVESTGGGRVYRTGDRVRRGCDGSLDFVGRDDGQAKVRGFRVEVGELESLLLDRADVAAARALVTASGTEDAQLLAFVCGKAGPPSADELVDDLARQLPQHMLPARIIAVDEFPLTPSGKLDTAALLGLAEQELSDRVRSEPQSATELALAGIWADVLGLEIVGVHDDFFEIGGTSINATRIAARTRQRLGVTLSLRTIFEGRTIAACAEKVEDDLAQRSGAQAGQAVAEQGARR